MEELNEVLADCKVSDWARSLAIGGDLGVRETLVFLERAFVHLSSGTQRRVIRRLRKADCDDDVEAILHELLVFEVCHEFDLAPQFEPDLQGQTPDLT